MHSVRPWIIAETPERPPGSPWRLLAAAIVVSAMIHGLTLCISPPAWQDEIQILDYGRTAAADADRSFAVTWSPRGRPVQPLTYAGCILQFGLFIAIASLGFSAYVLIQYLRHRILVPGWATLALLVSFLFGLLFIQLGVIGLYLGRTFEQSRNRPLYHVAEARNLVCDDPPP